MDPAKRFACPVAAFLGLALADDVFVKEKTAEAFATRSIRNTTFSKNFPIRKEKEDTLILRIINGVVVDPSKILKASSLHHALKALGQRCRYKEDITAYAFHRGFANGIDGNNTRDSIFY